MILIINTAELDKITVALADAGKKTTTSRSGRSVGLLTLIDTLLKKRKIKPADLDGIAVVAGPGRLTALRIGIIAANTLGWSLKRPVIGVKASEFDDIKDLVKISLKKIKSAKAGVLVQPYYGKEPNITRKKTKG